MEIARNCLVHFRFLPHKMKDKPSHLEFIKLQVGTPEGIKIWWGNSVKTWWGHVSLFTVQLSWAING